VSESLLHRRHPGGMQKVVKKYQYGGTKKLTKKRKHQGDTQKNMGVPDI
jgi:hypothetical protein